MLGLPVKGCAKKELDKEYHTLKRYQPISFFWFCYFQILVVLNVNYLEIVNQVVTAIFIQNTPTFYTEIFGSGLIYKERLAKLPFIDFANLGFQLLWKI